MPIAAAPLAGLAVITPRIFRDNRGYFYESFNAREFDQAGLPTTFVQDNLSRSAQGTVRGLHFQRSPYAQGKLVRVAQGAVFDVAVDIRPASKTFGQWFGLELSEENGMSLYVPPGFAHGFCVTSAVAIFHYKCTAFYEPKAEGAVRWDDPSLAIRWPACADPALVSEKDRRAPSWSEAKNQLS